MSTRTVMDKNKTIKDLLKDKSFLNWVDRSNQDDVDKWDSWRKENPDNEDLLNDAKAALKGFHFKERRIDSQQVNDSWNSFASKIQQNDAPIKNARVVSFPNQLLKIASVFLIGAMAFWGIKNWMANPSPELLVYQTGMEKIKSIDLPDGSNLILNTNSKVQFYGDFKNQNEQIIELEGEAFFKVAKQIEGKTFQVKTNDIIVEVVGTEFNINGKRDAPIISLSEGKVNLIKPDLSKEKLIQGQTAWFNQSQNKFEFIDNQSDYWKSWTLQKWSFGSGIPMQEVLDRIQETFDLKIQIKNSNILKKKASGDVSVENKEVLFEALSVLLDLEFEVRNDRLIISSLD